MTKKENIYSSRDFGSGFKVDNYPWGFKLKTQVRYWIETHPKKGDRFCKRTLNPKTMEWCKVKKSTYAAVMVMTLEKKDGKSFVSYDSLNRGYSDAVAVAKFEKSINKDFMLKDQLKQICACKAINQVNKNLKVEFVNSTAWTDEERAAHEKKQDEINGKLAAYTNKLYGSCLVKNNLVEKG